MSMLDLSGYYAGAGRSVDSASAVIISRAAQSVANYSFLTFTLGHRCTTPLLSVTVTVTVLLVLHDKL